MNWLRNLFMRRQIYRDLHEEIEGHIAEHVLALMAEGASRREAESAARSAFGNDTRSEPCGREAWMWPRTEASSDRCEVRLPQAEELAWVRDDCNRHAGARHRRECGCFQH